MKDKNIHNIYFLGIGGIGMSALARYFNSLGKYVAGYDRTPSNLTAALQKEGIDIHFSDEVENIPGTCRNKKNTLIVYTPAIPAENSELKYFSGNGFTIKKRSEVLGSLARDSRCIAVSGTHGKTTITTMIAYLLDQTGFGCSAFLGGISKNYNNNLIVNRNSDFVVVEADEFDRSFLQLFPFISIITAIDADHLDIYGSEDELVKSFMEFAAHTSKNGYLLIKKGLPLDKGTFQGKMYTYSLEGPSDYYACNIRIDSGKYFFDIETPEKRIENITLQHYGLTNVENSVAAIAVADILQIDHEKIRKVLTGFQGIKRRFDFRVETGKYIYVDDYAHHPKELTAIIGSMKKLFPKRKITGIFQPHLYSRTRDFAGEFAESLDLLDEVLLMDIYPARELPIPGITSEIIFNKINLHNKQLCNKENLMNKLREKDFEILLTMGAGDIDQFVEPIENMILEKETME